MRLAAGTVAALCVQMLICGCQHRPGSVTQPADKIAKPVELVYLTRATPEQLGVWQKAVRAFEEANPDIRVRLDNVEYRFYWAKLQTMVAGGTPPDVAFMESTRFPAFVKKGTLLKLDDFIAADKQLDLSDFYDIALDAYRWQGGLYGLPNDVAVIVTFFNKDLFDKAGIEYPKKGWTWADYLEKAKALTRDFDGDGRPDQYGTVVPPWWYVFVWMNGGDIVDNPANPTRSTLSSPEALEALQWLVDLRVKYGVSPSREEVENVGAYEMFATGRVAMVVGGHWDIPRLRETEEFEWDVAPLPKGKTEANIQYGSCYCIMKGSKHPKEAWRLIRFLACREGQDILLSSGFSTPALRSAAKSETFLAPPPEHAEVFIEAISHGHPMPFTPAYVEMADYYRERMGLMWEGREPVKETAAAVDAKINELLSAARTGD